MAAIGKVSAVFTASTSGLTSGVNRASQSMNGLQASVGGLRGSMQALVAIQGAQLFGGIVSGARQAAAAISSVVPGGIPGIGEAINQATTLGEELSKSSVIFGSAAGQVGSFAEVASAIGLSRTAALQATGSFGNLFTAMGLGQTEAANYATTLTSLGADLASFNNTTVDEAILALGAALRGEAEPIRRYGVLLDDATLKQIAFSRGLTASPTDTLSPAIKAQAAYAAILQQTGKAQGDFLRTSGGLANQQRIVAAEFDNVAARVGETLLPVYQQLIAGIRESLPAFEAAGAQVAALVASIDFGEVVGAAVSGFSAVVGAVEVLATVLKPVAENLIPALAGGFAVLNAGAIAAQFQSFTVALTAGSGAMRGMSVATFLASGAMKAFRTALITTGIGAIAVALGYAAEALIDWYTASGNAADGTKNVEKEAKASAAAIKKAVDEAMKSSTLDAGQAAGQAAVDAIKESGDAVSTAGFQTIDAVLAAAGGAVQQLATATPEPIDIQQTVEVSGIKEAVKGIESSSAEGLREMFRLMRGVSGKSVDEQQLEEQKRTNQLLAENLPGMGVDLDAVDLAPAAGG
jgi:hypothetical protein